MNKLLISISILLALVMVPVYAEQGTIQILNYKTETTQLFDVTIQICSVNEVMGEKNKYNYPQTLNLPTQTFTAYSDERKYGETHEHNGYVESNTCVKDTFTIVANDPKTIFIKSNDLEVIPSVNPPPVTYSYAGMDNKTKPYPDYFKDTTKPYPDFFKHLLSWEGQGLITFHDVINAYHWLASHTNTINGGRYICQNDPSFRCGK